MNTNMVISMVGGCLYGDRKNQHIVHADVLEMATDRYGVRVDIQLMNGARIVGRLSNGRRFNGTVTKNGAARKYRSKAARYQQRKAPEGFDFFSRTMF